MNKKKIYVLMVSDYFPTKHPRAGEKTFFPEKIKYGICRTDKFICIDCKVNHPDMIQYKFHTCRANYVLWKKRIDEINAGCAILSIRRWSGKPYWSEQIEIVQLDDKSGIGIQKGLFIPEIKDVAIGNEEKGKVCNISYQEIANNDGLSLEDFTAWFKRYDLSKPMAIIHFTDFRY